jgi:hypothetical protein
MLTVDLASIRNQIKSNISSTFTTYEVYDYEPKSPRFPCAIVSWPDTFDPRVTMAGDVDLTFPVRFMLVWKGDESSDQALMDAMEAAVNAIESDRNLGNNVDDISCGPLTNIGAVTMPDDTVIMQFVVPVEVLA